MALYQLKLGLNSKLLTVLKKNIQLKKRPWLIDFGNNDVQIRTKYMPEDPEDPIEADEMGRVNPKNPLKRVANVLKNDMKQLAKGRMRVPESEIFPSFCDVLIIGGGVIGASIAYFLKKRSGLELQVAIVEKDPTYATASTTLSVGGIRQQFSIPANVQMSMFGYEFLQGINENLKVDGSDPPEINFWPNGYLYLASGEGAETLQNNHKIQTELGAKVELLSKKQLGERFAWLNLDGIEMGSYGYSHEGWFDPHSLLNALKWKAVDMGVKYVKAEVVGFKTTALRGSVGLLRDGVEVARVFEKLDKIIVRLEDMNESRVIHAPVIILAGGSNSGRLAEMAGLGVGDGLLSYSVPVEPRKRFVYNFHCPDGPGLSCPLVIDPSGTYVRKDGLGGQYICGKSPSSEEEPDASNLDVDYTYFDDIIWPILAKRVPSFENIKLKNAYAGYYDYNTFDQNAIIGQHPYYMNLILATGFSGHGLQHAPAVGRGIMELIIDGGFKTIDLRPFSFDRILDDMPLFEANIV